MIFNLVIIGYRELEQIFSVHFRKAKHSSIQYFIQYFCNVLLQYSGQSWRRGTKCDYKIDWLWVRSPLEEIKYLFTFIFSFHRSGVETKCGVQFRHSTRNTSKTRRQVENGVSYSHQVPSASSAVCGIQREALLQMYYIALPIAFICLLYYIYIYKRTCAD